MMNKNSFAIGKNSSIIPPEFHCHDVRIQNMSFYGLQRMGCESLIAVDSPADWRIERNGRSEPDHLDLFLLSSGGMYVQTAEGTYHAQSGQILTIPSWIDRIVWIDEPGSHIYIRFNMSEKNSAIQTISVRNTPNVEAITFYTKMLLVDAPIFANETAYRMHLSECLAILCHRELYPAPERTSPEKAEQLIRQLQFAESSHLAVHAVAKQAGMSLSAFREFCLTNFGKSPGKLIDQVRMSRARALLSYSEYSIEDIATRLGYADRFAFSKAFTRLNSLTPVMFRKRKK